MTVIDERVVAMKFDHAQFEKGIQSSMTALDTLNKKLQMQGATKGLTNVASATKEVNPALANMEKSLAAVTDRFKTLGVVGMAAITNITNQAIFAGQNLVKSLTIDPVLKGFQEYETNMNSIQTILANTVSAGTKLSDVTAALDELNHYSDQTIYNFSEMAKNIGTFTAAGVGLKESTAAIKGIANLAALSGSNSQQASAAMYQLSQALSAGRVTLEDWNSVVNAGMGGTVFKRALAENAVAMGVLNKGAVKLDGAMKNVTINGKSFRDSISAAGGQETWLTSKVLTQTLQQFTGDLTDAQLAAQGFNDAQIKAIQAQAKMAKSAATEVKTFTQLVGTLAESAGSGWSQTWKTIFGDFEEAKVLFTNVNNVIGGFISSSADARNKVLSDWDKLGGRTYLIKAISNAFEALVAVVKPIGKAFREIFPATTGKQLADMSKALMDFTAGLKISDETAKNIGRTFKGFFAVLDIGWMIIKEVVKTIFDLVGAATEGSGGFLEFTGNIGDFLVKVRDAIKNGTGLKDTFKAIGVVLELPIRLVKTLIGFIGQLINAVTGMEIFENLSPMADLGDFAAKAWEKVLSIFENLGVETSGFADSMQNFFSNLGSNIADFVANISWGDVFAALGSGLMLVITQGIYQVLGGGGVTGIIQDIKDAFSALTGSLEAMQAALKATTLLQLAAAVLVLAFAMDKISQLDSNKIAASGAAITVLMADLAGAMIALDKFMTPGSYAKLPAIAATMILLAVAVNILANAMKKMAELDWEGVAKGLVSTTALIAGLVLAMKFMPDSANMIKAGAGVVLLAFAIKILANSVKDMAELDWGEMAKGLAGVGALLLALGLFARFGKVNDLGLKQSAGILLLALAVGTLAKAISSMAKMKAGETAEGLVAMSLAMVSIAGALRIMPKDTLQSAAALLVVGVALQMIGKVLKEFAEFDKGDIAGSLITLAGALNIISVSMRAMQTALPGAVALMVVAAALRVLLPVLQTLADMDVGDIAAALGTLAGVFIILGAAGYLLGPVVPVIMGLGVAVAAIGVGMALAGAGIFLFAAGLTLIAGLGAGAALAIGAFIGKLLEMVPQLSDKLAAAIVAILGVVTKAAPAFGEAVQAIIMAILDVIRNVAPKLIDTLVTVLEKLLDAIVDFVPKLVAGGMKLITGILNGIGDNIGKLVSAATKVITKFIDALGDNIPKVAKSGAQMIVKLVNGIAEAIRENSKAMSEAGANLARAIIEGMANGLRAGLGVIADVARGVANSALEAAKNVLGIASPSKEFVKIGKYVIDGFRKGLDSNKGDIWEAFNTLRDALKAMTKEAGEDVDKLEAKLKKLRQNGGSRKEIAKTKAQLAQAKKEEKASKQAYNTLTKNLKDETSALGKLADKYDVVTAKLEAARDVLADAKKTQEDYSKQTAEQYSDLASATAETKLADFISDTKKQIEDTKEFANAIQELRRLGLNDEMYKDLLATGPDALPFVKELLAGGKMSVDEINKMEKELNSLGSSIGKTASKNLYQAGVDAAAGLVKGLEQQQAAIEKQMDKIADAMVKAIKKKLGIKSPSKEFEKVGEWSADGLVVGLEQSTKLVDKAAATVGSSAVNSLQKTLSGVNKMALNGIDTNPVIRPVLDLTDIQKNAGKIGSLMPDAKMSVSGAYSNAARVTAAVAETQGGSGLDGDAVVAGSVLNYTQNNYSPKALPRAEIYRNTKNQLSVAKEALTPNAK